MSTTTRSQAPGQEDERAAIDEQVDACNAKTQDARLAYSENYSVRLGDELVITALAYLPGASIGDDEVAAPTATTTRTAKLGCYVRAHLTGSDDLNIRPKEWTEQDSFLDKDQISLVWHLQPKRAGTYSLTLEIRSYLVKSDGSEVTAGDLPPQRLNIEVEISTTTRLWQGSRELFDHPFWTAVGFGVLWSAFLYLRGRLPWRRERRSAELSQQGPRRLADSKSRWRWPWSRRR